MSAFIRFLFFIAALLTFSKASAGVYYVSTAGNDANAGSQTRPWRTISKANATLVAGDTVFVMEGVYHEQISPERSGQAGNEIVYARYGSDNVVIDGIPSSLEVAVINTDHIVLDGFHIQAQAFLTLLEMHRYWVRIDGNYVTLRNCRVVAPGDPRITYWQQRAYSRGIAISGTHATVENSLVRGQMMGIVIAGVAPRYTTLRYDTLFAHGASNLVIISPTDGGSQLQGNLIEYCLMDTSFEEDNIQFEPNYDDLDNTYNRGHVIRKNRLANAAENCLDFKGAADVILEGNLLHGCFGDNDGPVDGANYDGNDDWGGAGIHRGSWDVTNHVLVRENVIWDNHTGGAAFDRYHYYNNVFLNNRKSFRGSNSTNTSFEYAALEMWSVPDHQRSIINNIIAGQPNSGVLAAKIYWGKKLEIDYNLYYDEQGPITVRHDMDEGYVTVKGLSAWQSILASAPGYAYLQGKDAHSIEADPQFLNAPFYPVGYDSDWNFTVSPTSPASAGGRCATSATNAGTDATTLVVEDALFFSDGFNAVEGDIIRVGDGTAVRAAAIDYNSNMITLEESRTWAAGAGVHTYFSGSAPNIGLSGEHIVMPGKPKNPIDTPTNPPAPQVPGIPVLAELPGGSAPVPVTAYLQWSAANLAEWYQIQISMSSGFSPTVVDETNLTSQSYALAPLGFSTQYYARVRAFNQVGAGPWSSSRSFVMAAPIMEAATTTLAAPPDGTAGITTNPVLSWMLTQGASSYRIQMARSSDFVSPILDSSGLHATTCLVDGLLNGADYFWRIRAVNAEGSGPWSSVAKFQTFEVPLALPANVVVNSDFDQGTAGWVLSTDGEGDISVSSPGYKKDFFAKVHVLTLGSYVELFERCLMIQPDTVYRLSFSAYSSSGNDMEVAVVRDEPPFTTYGLASQRVQLSSVWKEYAFDFTSRNFTSFVNNARLVFRFDQYANPGDVFGIDGVQLAKLNAEPSASGVIPQDYNLSQNYPNPFNPTTMIRYGLPNPSNVTLTVFNALGQQIAVLQNGEQEAGYHEVKFDASGLASGLYLYRLTVGGFVQTRKMLLLH